MIRVLPSGTVNALNEVLNERFPMFPGFLEVMIRAGKYAVVDENGDRMPTSQALNLLGNKNVKKLECQPHAANDEMHTGYWQYNVALE